MEMRKHDASAGIERVSPRGTPGKFYSIVKRCFDLPFSLLCLLLLSPVLLVIAIAVHREDGGSVIYRRRCYSAKGYYDMLNLRCIEIVRRMKKEIGNW